MTGSSRVIIGYLTNLSLRTRFSSVILKQQQSFPPNSTDKATSNLYGSFVQASSKHRKSHTILNKSTLVVFLRDRREISGNFHLTRVLEQWLPSVTAIRLANLAPWWFLPSVQNLVLRAYCSQNCCAWDTVERRKQLDNYPCLLEVHYFCLRHWPVLVSSWRIFQCMVRRPLFTTGRF